jgi:predicted Zn-dependent protease
MILQESQLRDLLQKTMAANPGKTLALGVNASEEGSVRFADNAVSSSGVYNTLNLAVEVTLGQKRGTVVLNELSPDKIQDAVARAEAIARFTPENKEIMPLLGPQTYPATPPLHYRQTDECSPGKRVEAIVSVIERARKAGLTAAGFFETGARVSAALNSLGQYYFVSATRAAFNTTFRGGGGSGWAAGEEENVDALPIEELAGRAMTTSLDTRGAKPLAAGKYTVILEPAAVADFLFNLMYNYSAREADEGRSFLSKEGGKNRLGDRLCGPDITIWSDPAFPGLPCSPIGEDGLARAKAAWIEKGVVKNLITTRYWANKTGRSPVPFPGNILMEGGRGSVEDLIRSTDKGVLVRRLWYIRDLNPMILLLTGLTRDGVFWIEKGKISHPVNNFRFNESPVNILRNVTAMSKAERAVGGESGQSAFAPGLKVKEFNFSTISDAV